MPSVDNRVVEMRFDNKDFESGVSTSISSLEKLKKSLNLKSAADSLDEVDKASRRLDFSTISDAADAVTSKFSVFGTMADQVIRRLADSVYDLGQQTIGLVKSLSIDQVSAGWSKYADKTSAVQTIMAATAKDFEDSGVQMEYVNEQLGQLSWFTDETSYNFLDMVSNIGKFTSNGQKLDASVTAMQGISTWAAISGANAGEASRAMYNLSQALSTGAVKLMDWKSIENANMATVEFKETALQTAEAMGTLKKKSDGVYETLAGHEVTMETFNQNLKDEWFSSKVLMSTLDRYGAFTNALYETYEKFGGNVTTSEILEYIEEFQNGTIDLEATAKETGMTVEELGAELKKLGSEEYDLGRRAFKAAQEAKTFQEAIDATKDAVSSGWMESFEHLFGNYEEAKKLWTTVANELWEVFNGGAEARNAMLAEWHENGGYEKLWGAVSNFWEGLKGIGSRIGEVWSRIFPSLDSSKLLSITDKIYDFSEKFKAAFAGVEDAIEEVVEPVTDGIKEAATVTESYASRLEATTAVLSDLVDQVWAGAFGNGEERRKALEDLGYVYELVQNAVNESVGIAPAYDMDEVISSIEETTDATNGLTAAHSDAVKAFKEGRLDPPEIDELPPKYKSLAEQFMDVGSAADALHDILVAVGSAGRLLFDVAKAAAKYIAIPALSGAVKGFKALAKAIAPFARAFTYFVDKFREANTLEKNLNKIRMWLKGVINLAKDQPNVVKLLENFQKFKDWLSGIKTSALEKVTNFFDKIAGYNIKLPDFSDAAGWVNELAGKILELVDAVKNGWPQVEAFFNSLDFSGIAQFATSTFDQIKSFFQGLDFSGAAEFGSSTASSISEFFSSLFSNDDLKQTGENIFTNIWEGIVAKAQSINWSELLSTILKAFSAASLSSIGLGFADVLFGVGKFARKSADIPAKLVRILDGVKGVLKGYALDLKADAIIKIAGAIGILAVSLALLSSDLVDPAKLTTAAGAIAAVLGVVIGLVAVIGHFWGAASTVEEAVSNALVSVGKINIKLPKLAMTLGALAMTLLAITSAIAVFGFMPREKLIQGGIALGAIIVVMIGAYAALSAISKNMKNFKRLFASLIGMALALDFLIPVVTALTLLSKIDGGNALAGGVVSLLFLLGGMAAALWLLSAKTNGIEKVGGQFILMALALNMLVPVLAAIALLGKLGGAGALAGSVVTIIFLVATLGGAFALLSKIKTPENGLKAFGAMAAMLIGIAAALALLKGSSFKDLIGIAGAIMIFVAAMTVLGAVVGHFAFIGAGLIAIGIAIALIGAGVGLAGAGALAFAKALQVLADSSVNAKEAGKNLAEGIVAFFDVIMEKGQSIVAFIGLIITAILAAIVAHKANLVSTAVEMVVALAEALKGGTVLATVLSAIGVFLAGVLSWLGVKLESIASSLISLVLILVNSVVIGLLDNLPMIRQAISSFITTLGYVVLETVTAVFGGIFDAIAQLLPESNFAKVWTGWKEGLKEAEQSTANDLRKTNDELRANINKQGNDLRTTVKSDSAETANTIQTSHSDVDAAINEKFAAKQSGTNPVQETFSEMTDAAVTGSAETSSAVSGGMDSVLKTMLESFDGSEEQAADITKFFQEGLAQGLFDNLDLPADASTQTGMELINTLKNALGVASPSKEAQTIGGYFDEGLALGINNWKWLVNSPVARLVSAAISGLSNIGYRSYVYGYYFDLGLANGVSDYSYLVSNKVAQMATDAITTLAETIDSASPSKVTIQYGKYFDQGMAIGVNKNSGLVTDAVNTMGSGAVGAMGQVVTRIMDAINGDFDMSPTIRPVLDLSEIQNGGYQLNSMISGYGPTFTPALSYANGLASRLGYGSVDVRNDDGSTRVVSAINELRQEVNTLNEDIKNLNLVLDSGQVVGGISRKMDRSLGKIEAYKERGI